MLKAQKITKTFYHPIKSPILKGVDIEVLPGETVAIMGTSGVGKSTLLHILGTLEKPDSGTLEIAHSKIGSKTDQIRNKHVGFIFQAFFLLEHLTVLDNILMPAKIGRQPTHKGSKAYQRALFLIDQVGLSQRAEHLAKQLSGGEKQRTCIARALMNQPSIIFADEPTGNLDQKTSKQIQEVLLKQVKAHQKSLLLATHDADFAKKCDRAYQLKEGKLFPIDLTFK